MQIALALAADIAPSRREAFFSCIKPHRCQCELFSEYNRYAANSHVWRKVAPSYVAEILPEFSQTGADRAGSPAELATFTPVRPSDCPQRRAIRRPNTSILVQEASSADIY